MKDANTFPLSKRKRRALELTQSASKGARIAAFFCAGLAATAVEVIQDNLHAGPNAATHYYAYAVACPAFTLSLICLERMNQASWRKALLACWPWTFLLLCAAVAVMPHPRWAALVLLTASTFGFDQVAMAKDGSSQR